MKIIIIDDEFNILKSLKRNLLVFDKSIEVDLSHSVEDALTKISMEDYDCIVSDLNMPKHDGLVLLKHLHVHKIQTPLIIMTGCPKTESAVECMKTGAADFITKPFSAETLIQKINEHSSEKKAWNEGYQLGEYVLKELISETTSSLVFSAYKPGTDNLFAIKALKNEELGISKTAYRRFEREINILSTLKHPNIVNIIECGLSEHGIPYIVMPFIKGENFEDKINEIDIEDGLEIISSLAETLSYIHNKNIVHRDIKPGNIIISDGKPVLLDFGIILVQQDIQLTQEGMIVGTPNYMAPEAFNDSHAVDYRADIYSLGVLLYRIVYKKCPFEGADLYSVIKNILSYSDIILYKGSKFDELIKKLINKDPSKRLDSALSVIDELNSIKKNLI